MIQCCSSLIACFQLNPDDVALRLSLQPLPVQLLPPGFSNYQKAQYIVDIMKDSVMENPPMFDIFLKALEGAGSWTGKIVSELKRTRLSLQHPGKLAPRAREIYVAIYS